MIDLTQLVDEANTELTQLATANEGLTLAQEQRTQAANALEQATSDVDTANAVVSTERSQAIEKLRAIVSAVNAKIEELQPAA